MNYLANCVSCLSLLCGFASLIFSFHEQFALAAMAILYSAVFDALDGQLVRSRGTSNEFGKQIDSLVDVIAFGIAPSILGYVFVGRHPVFWPIAICFMYLACAVFRLAKYNVTSKEKMGEGFCGLPTTVSGMILASFILAVQRYMYLPVTSQLFLFTTLGLAILMISPVRYPNLASILKLKAVRWLVAVGVGVGLVTLQPWRVLFLLFLIYLLFSPFVVQLKNHRRKDV